MPASAIAAHNAVPQTMRVMAALGNPEVCSVVPDCVGATRRGTHVVRRFSSARCDGYPITSNLFRISYDHI